MDRHVLFTNLRAVHLGAFGFRFPCSALLLSDLEAVDDHVDGARECEARAFGPDPNWEIFRCELASVEYKVLRSGAERELIEARGPLVTGAALAFRFGPVLELHAAHVDSAICVDRFDVDAGDYAQVWEYLRARVREFWHAPNFPALDYRPFRRGGG